MAKFSARNQAKRRRAVQKKLRQARKEAGLTQTEVAHAMGRKHASFISKIESGERRIDVIDLEDLARLYGKSVSHFL